MTKEEMKAEVERIGLPIAHLARVLGVSRSTLVRYLNGSVEVNKFFAKDLRRFRR
jgi:transcriptional regulator with XRE-family HTH domain